MRHATLFLIVACSSGRWATSSDSKESSDTGDGVAGPTAFAPPGDSAEQELESTYQTPVATGRHVWIANPSSGRVAYVDAVTLETHTVLAGNGPTYVTALGTEDKTAVINVGSDDATVFALTSAGVTSRSVAIAPGMNAWATSSSGRFAVAWADARRVPNAPATRGFQDLSVIDLDSASDTATLLSVGYRPSAISFDASETQAFVTNQDGITVVALLPEPHVTAHYPLTADTEEGRRVRDVSITLDGAHAFARIEGSADVVHVALADGALTRTTLPGVVTDLDLVAGGNAVAMMREAEQLAIFGVSGPPELLALAGSGAGSVSVSSDGAHGLAYTNASAVESVAIIGLSPLSARAVRVYASVLAAFPSPDGANAVVLHAAAQPAFSLLPMQAPLPPKIVDAVATPFHVAFSRAADRALIVQRDDTRSAFAASLCRLPGMAVQTLSLGSPPIAAGIVEGARRAYVAQLHEQGRLTFIDLDTGDARTLTGFELAARVVTQ